LKDKIDVTVRRLKAERGVLREMGWTCERKKTQAEVEMFEEAAAQADESFDPPRREMKLNRRMSLCMYCFGNE